MSLIRYDNCICDRIDKTLLNKDKFTFSVLIKILQKECTLTITDGKRLIICFSNHPFPVWVWLPDDATKEEMEIAYQEIKNSFGFDSDFKFNTKYFIADYFINRAKSDGFSLSTVKSLKSYMCDSLMPERVVDGHLKIAEECDIDLLVEFSTIFHKEINSDIESEEVYRRRVKEKVEEQSFFLWIDAQGNKVACCSYSDYENYSSVGSVYTPPQYRRKGYAYAIVREVTKKILARKRIPVLYTDADYAASNSCYTKIGYELKGELCTIK
ncbi:MAG: GNAT family N-acetyltransferase [Clostridia bacterium]|nr:GNAT family N-acetyltransferase [Clostridia bacterium]